MASPTAASAWLSCRGYQWEGRALFSHSSNNSEFSDAHMIPKEEIRTELGLCYWIAEQAHETKQCCNKEQGASYLFSPFVSCFVFLPSTSAFRNPAQNAAFQETVLHCHSIMRMFCLIWSHPIASPASLGFSLSVWHDRNPPPQFPTFRSLIPQTHSMCSIPIVTQTFKTVTLCFAQPELRAHLKKTGKSIFLIRIPCWCAWGALFFLLFLSVFYSVSHSFFSKLFSCASEENIYVFLHDFNLKASQILTWNWLFMDSSVILVWANAINWLWIYCRQSVLEAMPCGWIQIFHLNKNPTCFRSFLILIPVMLSVHN